MKRALTTVSTWLIVLAAFASQAGAHYLWVTIDSKSGEHGTTNIYFEGGPGAGDGQYLDPFVERGTTWIRTLGESKPTELKVQDTKQGDKRWLSGALTAAGPRSIDSYGKWGVYRYGKTDVLLHYHARNLDVEDHDDLHELGRAEQMKLDIVPHDDGAEVQLRVLWQGKPALGRPMAIRGPGGFKQSLKTDESGYVRFEPKAKGRYTFHTTVEEKQEGTDDGKDYQLIRHHGTLIMNLPLSGQ
jgi:hypothetical protein